MEVHIYKSDTGNVTIHLVVFLLLVSTTWWISARHTAHAGTSAPES